MSRQLRGTKRKNEVVDADRDVKNGNGDSGDGDGGGDADDDSSGPHATYLKIQKTAKGRNGRQSICTEGDDVARPDVEGDANVECGFGAEDTKNSGRLEWFLDRADAARQYERVGERKIYYVPPAVSDDHESQRLPAMYTTPHPFAHHERHRTYVLHQLARTLPYYHVLTDIANTQHLASDMCLLVSQYCVTYDQLGLTYEKQENWREAFEEYRIGMICEQSGECAYRCGRIFAWGMNCVKTDDRRAVACFEYAVSRGSMAARSLLAEIYYFGFGNIPAERAKGEKLYADSDDVFGKMSIVKLEPLTKTNVENDVVALYMPHLRAMACAGDIRAIVELGACYKYGKSLPQSDTECNKWWNIAANQGRCDIQRSMGVRIEAGTGLEKKDYDTAFLWYMKSAVQGHFEAMCYVGECYQDGVGVAKNRGLAKLWCERALQGNVDKVTERSNILLRTMARADAALLDPP